MGKQLQQNLQLQQTNDAQNRGQRCSAGLSSIFNHFSFRCFFVLILSLSLLLSVIFWILPLRTPPINGFDAKDPIKLSASVQVYFRLQKPVSELVPLIGRLEYDINDEIGVPSAKVTILSVHASGSSNWTDVVFGVLSDPINVPIPQVYLSVLRSSLIDVFLGEYNLTLTSQFGQPTLIEILKFPGGITVVPVPYVSIWQFHHVFFSFTLNNSIAEVLGNFSEFRQQLKAGLNLRSYEYVVVQLSNDDGSTIDSPVSVRASFISDLGSILPQRLQQLAQTISDSHSKNLGLNNSIFGKVKSVSLSTYLKRSLYSQPPTPSPSPAPNLNNFTEPPFSPSLPPAYSPIESPKGEPHHSPPPVHSPAPCVHRGSAVSPSPSHAIGRRPSVSSTPLLLHPSQSPVSPHVAPVGSPLSRGSTSKDGSVSPLVAPSPSPTSLASVPFRLSICWTAISGLVLFHFLYCQH